MCFYFFEQYIFGYCDVTWHLYEFWHDSCANLPLLWSSPISNCLGIFHIRDQKHIKSKLHKASDNACMYVYDAP